MSGTFRYLFLIILLIPSKGTAGLSAVWIPVFFFAVFAAVDFLFFIGQEEDLVKLLLDGSDTARIPAGDDILDLLWKMQLLFLIDLVVLDDVDCDIVIIPALIWSNTKPSWIPLIFNMYLSFLPILFNRP